MRREIHSGFIRLCLAVSILMLSTCSGGKTDRETYIAPSLSDQVIEIYFFHFSRKCNSCEAIKSEIPAFLQQFYPEEWKSGKIVFRMVNTETDQGKEIARDLDIIGQQVLIFKGTLSIEITQPAFLFAHDDPERFGAILKEEIDKLL